MQKIKVSGKTGECNLIIGESIKNFEKYCENKKLVIITDRNVRGFHEKSFPKGEIIEMGLRESSKTLETIQKIYNRMLELEVDKSWFLVGIGGGIVCDVAGFAASTYLRGLRFGFIPTTLLAQVDASIGGKNGVNFQGYKNIIGSIRQPEFCISDFELLKTLPEKEMRNGLAEVVKYGAISSRSLFEFLEDDHEKVMNLDRNAVDNVVYESAKIKAEIVNKDEFENGERMKLNFGHTLGHAIEKTIHLTHGEAISIGMTYAAKISVEMKMLKEEEAVRIEKLFKSIGLPTTLNLNDSLSEKLIEAVRKDKKRRSEEINMILLESIGSSKIVKIPIEELKRVL